MTEFLPSEDIRQMNFHHRCPQLGDRIRDGDRGVSPRGRVHHDRCRFVRRLVDPLHKAAFVIGLTNLDIVAEFPADVLAQSHKRSVIVLAVNRRLTLTEPIQVRPVQHYDLHDDTFPNASACSDAGTSDTAAGCAMSSRRTKRCVEPRFFLSTTMA